MMSKSLLFAAFFGIFSTLAHGAVDRSAYFPSGYVESRATFREMTGLAHFPDAERGQFLVPSKTDPDLTVDWFHWRARTKDGTLFVLISGTHGPEAYAGSALQRLFVAEILPAMKRDQSGVFLVHSLNPYGFKYGRRVTENNVDLNRNFGLGTELFRTRNEGYGKFLALLAPARPVKGIYLPLAATVTKIGWELIFGNATRAELTESIESGQYQWPQAIQFGGQAFEPQTLAFMDILRREAAGYARVVLIDIHTGLGEKGVLHFLTGHNYKLNSPSLIEKFVRQHPDPSSFKLTTGETDGFYNVTGDVTDVVPLVLPGVQVLSFTAEFGTLGKSLPLQIDSLQRLIQENQGFHHGYASKETEDQVKARFMQLFYPEKDAEWKQAVLDRGYRFLKNCSH